MLPGWGQTQGEGRGSGHLLWRKGDAPRWGGNTRPEAQASARGAEGVNAESQLPISRQKPVLAPKGSGVVCGRAWRSPRNWRIYARDPESPGRWGRREGRQEAVQRKVRGRHKRTPRTQNHWPDCESRRKRRRVAPPLSCLVRQPFSGRGSGRPPNPIGSQGLRVEPTSDGNYWLT